MGKDKKKAAFKWGGGDWMILWVLGGFVLAYFVYIPITGDKVHPLHWLFGILGGLVGYGVALFVDSGLPPVVRFVRSRGAIVNRVEKDRRKGKAR